MLLGKRARPAVIRRTTSMSGMSLDTQFSNTEPHEASDPDATMPIPQPYPQPLTLSPRNTSMDTPHFLRTCGLCNRRLAPGRDIYMYRGDTAFCSLECREERMKRDERKGKWKVVSKKEDPPPTSTASKASTKSETVAAA